MKFGQKQTMRDKAATIEKRLGKTTGASKARRQNSLTASSESMERHNGN